MRSPPGAGAVAAEGLPDSGGVCRGGGGIAVQRVRVAQGQRQRRPTPRQTGAPGMSCGFNHGEQRTQWLPIRNQLFLFISNPVQIQLDGHWPDDEPIRSQRVT